MGRYWASGAESRLTEVLKDFQKVYGYKPYYKKTSIMPKSQAHLIEKYKTSLYYHSTGLYPPEMKAPFPVDFNTGKRINPFIKK